MVRAVENVKEAERRVLRCVAVGVSRLLSKENTGCLGPISLPSTTIWASPRQERKQKNQHRSTLQEYFTTCSSFLRHLPQSTKSFWGSQKITPLQIPSNKLLLRPQYSSKKPVQYMRPPTEPAMVYPITHTSYFSQSCRRNTPRIGPTTFTISLPFANISSPTAASLNAVASGGTIITVPAAHSILWDAGLA